MNPNSDSKPLSQRVRYVITRPCLQSGTITLSRTLASALPTDGPLVFVGEAGEEILASIDSQTHQVKGLSDYFSRARLNVNDMLYITPLGDRHFQLESVHRNRDDARPEARVITPPASKRKRVVGEETPYVREVREVRVSPYPKGLIYPQENQSQDSQAQDRQAQDKQLQDNQVSAEILQQPETQALTEVVLVSQENKTQEAKTETNNAQTVGGSAHEIKPEYTLPNATEARFQDGPINKLNIANAPSLNAAISDTPNPNSSIAFGRPIQQNNLDSAAPTSKPSATEFSAPQHIFSTETTNESVVLKTPDNTNQNTGNIGTIQDCFEALGYDIKPVGGDRWLLSAPLGRRSYRIALITPMGGISDEQWQALLDTAREHNAKYLAVAGRERLLAKLAPPKNVGRLSRVDLDMLESLRELSKLAPLGPLEIEGYWNAGWIDQEAIDSLRTTVSQRVQMRGLFSYVTLALGKFTAPGIVSMDELMEELEGSGVGREAVLGILASLAEAPFFAVAPLGDGEYYLRQSVSAVLSGVADYASSLKQHLALAPKE